MDTKFNKTDFYPVTGLVSDITFVLHFSPAACVVYTGQRIARGLIMQAAVKDTHKTDLRLESCAFSG